MAILNILEFPDARLRTVAKPIKNVDERIVKYSKDMLETMYEAPGIGLAATQVNIHLQLIVIDISDQKTKPIFLINPVIIKAEGKVETSEGCLSIPGYSEPIIRYENIEYEALDISGKEIREEATGLLAVCIQHELDHLQGKLMVDHISSTKRQLIRKKLLKQQKQHA